MVCSALRRCETLFVMLPFIILAFRKPSMGTAWQQFRPLQEAKDPASQAALKKPKKSMKKLRIEIKIHYIVKGSENQKFSEPLTKVFIPNTMIIILFFLFL